MCIHANSWSIHVGVYLNMEVNASVIIYVSIGSVYKMHAIACAYRSIKQINKQVKEVDRF